MSGFAPGQTTYDRDVVSVCAGLWPAGELCGGQGCLGVGVGVIQAARGQVGCCRLVGVCMGLRAMRDVTCAAAWRLGRVGMR